jgi:alkylhydroperoxidase/carboxymuconolactone decarboxylase family protein YurZ
VERIGTVQDGLDVSRPDVTTEEEIAAYRAEYLGTNKGLLDSFEFWLEFRPDVLKRHKARTRHFRSTLEPDRPLVSILGAIHHYTVAAFREGVAYEIRLAQSLGATRTDILDTLSVAFIHAGHPGMYAAAAYADFLRSYDDPAAPARERFPEEWSFDPGAFDSGMDYSRREADARDIELLVDWYERTLGEVPGYVRFLAGHRPGLLKAYRDRYEHAIRDSLPKQMLPYLLLGHNVVRGFRDGIRENVLLGRALGMTREQLLDAICHSVLHAGVEALSVAQEAAGDLLDEEWPEAGSS